MGKKFLFAAMLIIVGSALVHYSASAQTKLIAADCGASNVDLTKELKANPVQGANQYEFKVEKSSGGHSEILAKSTNTFKLMELSEAVSYNTKYEVSVRAKKNETWGDFGPKCDITTKSQPTTQLRATDCGKSNVKLEDILKATTVPNASQYEFRVANTSLNYSESVTKNGNSFKLSELTGKVQPSTVYEVDVRTKIGAGWTEFGSKCSITTGAEINPSSKLGGGTQTPFSNYWSLTGNTVPQSPTFLGTINAYDLIFKTSDVERMRINTAGKVAIGVGNTVARLQAFENVKNEIGFVTGDLSARHLQMVPYVGENGWNGLSKEGDIAIIFKNQNLNAGNSGLVIGPHSLNTLGMRMDTNGNVGIGTSDPEAALDVREYIQVKGNIPNTDERLIGIKIEGEDCGGCVGLTMNNVSGEQYTRTKLNFSNSNAPVPSSIDLFSQINNASSSSFIMRNQGNGSGGWLDFLDINLSTNNIVFNANRSGGNPFGNLVVANGKVGIGTTTPIQTLDVNGRMNVSLGVIQKGGQPITSTGDLGLYSQDPNTWMRFVTNGQPMRFYSDGGIGTNANMTIAPSGKVGIGTDAPQSKLHIHNGRIKLTGYDEAWSTSWTVALETEPGAAMRMQATSNMNNFWFGYGITNTGWYWITANGHDASAIVKYPMRLEVDNCGRPKLKITAEEKWCDYVFDETYQRPTFEEQEQFLKKNKHLRGIASEKEIVEDGLDITGTMKGLTLNTEEMRLDMIELHKRLIKLEKENEELKKELEKKK